MADEATTKEKVEFLKNHFRYYTMNPWNESTSFAANVKVDKFVPKELYGTALDMIDLDEPYEEISGLFNAFAETYNYAYQMGFNGHSGGYIVLYRGGRERSEYKSRCGTCGQLNFKPVGEVKKCGRCGIEDMLPYSGWKTHTYPGRGIELKDEGDEGEVDELYEVVKDFDACVEACKEIFLGYCREYSVVDEVVTVPKTIKTLQRKSA